MNGEFVLVVIDGKPRMVPPAIARGLAKLPSTPARDNATPDASSLDAALAADEGVTNE